MKERVIPPHLITQEDEEKAKEKRQITEKITYGRQGPSKYGKGGRRAYVAKGKKNKK